MRNTHYVLGLCFTVTGLISGLAALILHVRGGTYAAVLTFSVIGGCILFNAALQFILGAAKAAKAAAPDRPLKD